MDDLIRMFNESGVRYLLVGGQAMRLEGMPRFSMDWDFYIPPTDLGNFDKLNALLEDEFDLPLIPLGTKGENFIQTYQTRWGIVQFHLAGPGFPPFDEAERGVVTRRTELGTPVQCVSTRHLTRMKQASDRPQDKLDIEFLVEKQKHAP